MHPAPLFSSAVPRPDRCIRRWLLIKRVFLPCRYSPPKPTHRTLAVPHPCRHRMVPTRQVAALSFLLVGSCCDLDWVGLACVPAACLPHQPVFQLPPSASEPIPTVACRRCAARRGRPACCCCPACPPRARARRGTAAGAARRAGALLHSVLWQMACPQHAVRAALSAAGVVACSTFYKAAACRVFGLRTNQPPLNPITAARPTRPSRRWRPASRHCPGRSAACRRRWRRSAGSRRAGAVQRIGVQSSVSGFSRHWCRALPSHSPPPSPPLINSTLPPPIPLPHPACSLLVPRSTASLASLLLLPRLPPASPSASSRCALLLPPMSFASFICAAVVCHSVAQLAAACSMLHVRCVSVCLRVVLQSPLIPSNLSSARKLLPLVAVASLRPPHLRTSSVPLAPCCRSQMPAR